MSNGNIFNFQQETKQNNKKQEHGRVIYLFVISYLYYKFNVHM